MTIPVGRAESARVVVAGRQLADFNVGLLAALAACVAFWGIGRLGGLIGSPSSDVLGAVRQVVPSVIDPIVSPTAPTPAPTVAQCTETRPAGESRARRRFDGRATGAPRAGLSRRSGRRRNRVARDGDERASSRKDLLHRRVMRDTRPSHRHRAAPRHRAHRKQPSVQPYRIDQHVVPHPPHLPRVTTGGLYREPLPDRIGRVCDQGDPDELCDPDSDHDE